MKVQRKILTPFKSREARVVGGRKVVERRGLSIKIEIMIKEIVLSSSFKLQTLAPLHTTHAKNLLWSFQWHPAQKTHLYRTIPVWEKLQNCSSISFFGAHFAMSLWSCPSIPFCIHLISCPRRKLGRPGTWDPALFFSSVTSTNLSTLSTPSSCGTWDTFQLVVLQSDQTTSLRKTKLPPIQFAS